MTEYFNEWAPLKKIKHKIPWAHILMKCAAHAYAGYNLCKHKCICNKLHFNVWFSDMYNG
jgi:hypothetical protein